MFWTEALFKVKKPIISMLHMQPLPGDPLFKEKDSMRRVVALARADLHAIQDGGVDGIIFSNEFSLPYQRRMSFVTPSAMARVIGELMNDIRVPYGVDCISDGLATIELAAAVDASFARGTFPAFTWGMAVSMTTSFPNSCAEKALCAWTSLNCSTS